MKKKPDIRLITGILGLFIIIIYTFTMLSGYRTAGRETSNTGSKDISGYYIFSTLLKRLGYKVKRANNPAATFMSPGIMVCFDYSSGNPMLERRFEDWLKKGNSLFFAGVNAEFTPLMERPVLEGEPEQMTVNEPLNRDIYEISFQPRKYFSGTGSTRVLIETNSGAVLTSEYLWEGDLFLLTESTLLTNQYMKEEDVAVLINNIFSAYYGKTVYIFEQLEFYDKMPSPVMILFKGPLFFITMHLLLMTGLFFYWKGKRFGNAVAYKPFARRTISNHIKAVGEFYFRVKANKLADSLEADYFLYKVHNILGEHKNLSKDELGRILAKFHGVSERDFRDLMTKENQITTDMLFARRDARNKILQKLCRSDYGK